MPCCVYVLSCFSCVQLIETLWTVACQAPLSMGFSRQEHWSGLLCPPPGIFLTQGWKPHLLCLSLALAGGFFATSAPRLMGYRITIRLLTLSFF